MLYRCFIKTVSILYRYYIDTIERLYPNCSEDMYIYIYIYIYICVRVAGWRSPPNVMSKLYISSGKPRFRHASPAGQAGASSLAGPASPAGQVSQDSAAVSTLGGRFHKGNGIYPNPANVSTEAGRPFPRGGDGSRRGGRFHRFICGQYMYPHWGGGGGVHQP